MSYATLLTQFKHEIKILEKLDKQIEELSSGTKVKKKTLKKRSRNYPNSTNSGSSNGRRPDSVLHLLESTKSDSCRNRDRLLKNGKAS